MNTLVIWMLICLLPIGTDVHVDGAEPNNFWVFLLKLPQFIALIVALGGALWLLWQGQHQLFALGYLLAILVIRSTMHQDQ